MNRSCALLLLLLYAICHIANAEVSYTESWDLLYYSSGLASQTLNLNVTLSSENPSLASFVKVFTGNVCTNCSELKTDLTVYLKLEHSHISFPLLYDNLYTSAYEEFEYDESCPVSYNIGPCYEEDNRPPEDNGYENYVMCCLGSTRGFGNHCLRYNYSNQYEAYYYQNPANNTLWLSTKTNLTVNDENTGNIHTLSVNSAGDYVSSDNMTFEVELKNVKDVYSSSLDLNSSVFEPYHVFVPVNTTGEIVNDSDVFLVKKDEIPTQLSISAKRWAEEVECTMPLFSSTSVHFDILNVRDQFYTMKNLTLSQMFHQLNEYPSYVTYTGGSSILFVFNRPLTTTLNIKIHYPVMNTTA